MSQDAEGDDGFVVEVLGSGLKGADRFEDGCECAIDGLSGRGVPLEKGAESVGAVHLAVYIFRVDDAIGEEDDEVSGAGVDDQFVVGHAGEEAEGEAFDGDGANVDGVGEIGLVGGDEEGWTDPALAMLQGAGRCRPRGP